MVDLSLYKKHLTADSISSLVENFQESIIITNRTADFFVNWEKIRENAEVLRIELSLINTLIGSKKIESDFRKLIKEYPETVRAIPILIAVRDLAFPVIIDFFDIEKGVKNLDFNKTRYSNLSEEEIESYLRFMENSGLFILFDTHARPQTRQVQLVTRAHIFVVEFNYFIGFFWILIKYIMFGMSMFTIR